MKPTCCFAFIQFSMRAGATTIFDNTGLVVPELDADGLPPPGTRLRKGMALSVNPLPNKQILPYSPPSVIGRWILSRG